MLPIKMLRKKEDGSIEVFYVDSYEEKQMYDTYRKKYRRLNQELDTNHMKKNLQERQKVARELRTVITELKKIEDVEVTN